MTQPHVVLLYQRQGGQIFLTTVREHVVADVCTAQVHRVLLKSNLTKNKQANKQNQTLRFIFEKKKDFLGDVSKLCIISKEKHVSLSLSLFFF